ncbi:DUF805 domain-containing protein [Methyloceanibacter superfactus]|uniref:DUF805 domain-containing protein n=1 Tax=Methyloceanibacter superfactus TaxID=1774969 RepID=UPI00244ED7DB|nr:DUF805 domain-containing protein [Methyloceanibacter superfactus]
MGKASLGRRRKTTWFCVAGRDTLAGESLVDRLAPLRFVLSGKQGGHHGFSEILSVAPGRANRKQFWLWLILPAVVVSIVFAMIDSAMGTFDAESGMGLLSGLWTLIILIPSIFIYIKRFHDRDKSGWWVLIGLIPIIGALWLIIELGFLKGTPGPNRFGPPVTD